MLASCRSPCYIVGDLNCPATDWLRCTAPADYAQNKLLDFTMKHHFVWMITYGTRNESMLDIVPTNEAVMLAESELR